MTRRLRADRRRRKDLMGAGLIVLVAAVLGGVAFASMTLRTPAFDPDTLCLEGKPAHTLILIDATDALDIRQARRLKTVALQEAARLPRWGRLTVEGLRPDAASPPLRLFSACTPGDRTQANALWEDVARLESLKQERFDGPLESALSARPREGPRSPIVEGLAASVADPAFQGPGRRLVLVSDLLEFADGGFSAYAAGADWAAYRRSRGALQSAPDLTGVPVRVLLLERANRAPAQTAARAGFWDPFFADSGTPGVTWDR